MASESNDKRLFYNRSSLISIRDAMFASKYPVTLYSSVQ